VFLVTVVIVVFLSVVFGRFLYKLGYQDGYLEACEKYLAINKELNIAHFKHGYSFGRQEGWRRCNAIWERHNNRRMWR
jgi:hypothetical protein